MRCFRCLLVVLLLMPFCLASHDIVAQTGERPELPVIQEAEPNDTPETAQVITPGQKLTGSFSAEGEVDCYAIECDETTFVDVTLEMDEDINYAIDSQGFLHQGTAGRWETYEYRYLRFPAGRTVWTLTSRNEAVGDYSIALHIVDERPGVEIEPNHEPKQANGLRPGESITGLMNYNYPNRDVDEYLLHVDTEGVHYLAFDMREPDGTSRPERIEVDVDIYDQDDKRIYEYFCRERDDLFTFYPYLEPGTYRMRVRHEELRLGQEYRVEFNEIDPDVDEALNQQTRDALDAGVNWLIDNAENPPRSSHQLACMSFALMGICEGRGADERVEDRGKQSRYLIAQMQKYFEETEAGYWKGAKLFRLGGSMYAHAMGTLALAEAYSAGFSEAREPCEKCIKYLLGSQLTGLRVEAWKPVAADSDHHGGWRYDADSYRSDLSVTGWCQIALYAAAATGIELDGMTQSVDWSIEYMARCGVVGRGFRYEASGGNVSSCCQSIGALLCELFGIEHPALEDALNDVNRNQCAGTQVGHGHPTPFYYWYYATRALFLRGGEEWQTWRWVTMKQLIRRQQDDGTWATLDGERVTNEQYTTGLAVMILRLCLNEPPAYLSVDLEGF